MISPKKSDYILPGAIDSTAIVIPNQPDSPFLAGSDGNATLSIDICLPEEETLERLSPLELELARQGNGESHCDFERIHQ